MFKLIPRLSDGIIETLINVIFDLINGILTDFLGDVILRHILPSVYTIVVVIPMQVINLLVAAFKFFSSGMMSLIFNIEFNFSGTGAFYVNNFSLFTPFGYTILFFFVIGMMIFFTNFLFSFTQKTKVDASGTPMSAQVRRFQYLKWPMLMVVMLLVGPVVLCFLDVLVGLLLNRIQGVSRPGITVNDINQSQALMAEITAFRGQFNSYFYGQLTTVDEISKEYSDLFNVLGSGHIIFNTTAYTSTQLLAMKTQLNNDTLFTCLTSPGNTFGSLPAQLTSLHISYSEIKYIMNNEFEIAYANAIAALQSLRVGQAVSSDNVAKLRTLQSSITTIYSNMSNISTNIKNISASSLAINKSWQFGQAAINSLPELLSANAAGAIGGPDLGTPALPGSGVDTIGNQLVAVGNSVSQVNYDTVGARQYFNAAQNSIVDTTGDYYKLFGSYGSSYNKIIYGTSSTSSLNTFILKEDKPTMVIPDDQIVRTLYSAITGDKGENWSRTDVIYWLDGGERANFVQWIFGVLSIFGMFMIMWNYTSAAMKRTFYLVAYWMVGFLYLSYGITNEQGIKSWFKMFIGKWWCIITLFLLMELVSVIMPIIVTATFDGLSQNTSLMYGGINFLAQLGVVFMFETGYQLIYTVWNKYQGSFGAGEEQFQATESFMMTQGKNGLDSAIGGITKGAKTAWAVVWFIPSVFKKVKNAGKWFKDRSDKKTARENSSEMEAKAQTQNSKDKNGMVITSEEAKKEHGLRQNKLTGGWSTTDQTKPGEKPLNDQELDDKGHKKK